MMNVFIVAAGAGGDRWLMKNYNENGAVFLFVAVAERKHGEQCLPQALCSTAAWRHCRFFEVETKKNAMRIRSDSAVSERYKTVQYKLSNN